MAINTELDVTELNDKIQKYLSLTNKTLQKAINDKLFDLARFSLKETDKAKRSELTDKLNSLCFRYPKFTLAEIIVLSNKEHFSAISEAELKSEAKKLTNIRGGHCGYVKSGWIQPMKELMPYIGKQSVAANGVPKDIIGQGGAEPIKNPNTNVYNGSVFNDTFGGRNGEQMKVAGAQAAVNAVVADMDKYFDRKLQEAANKTINK